MCVCCIGGVGCPADWVWFTKSCYFFSAEKLTFDNALRKCNDMSSSMVIINDNEEQVRGELKVGKISWGGGKKTNLRKQENVFKILASTPTVLESFCLYRQIKQHRHCMQAG